jgi:hypothetical protein
LAGVGKFWGTVILVVTILFTFWLGDRVGFSTRSPVVVPVEVMNAGDIAGGLQQAPPAAPAREEPAEAAPTRRPATDEDTSGSTARVNSGMWGPAGPAPTTLTGSPMYHPDGSGTIIGWVVPGPVNNLPAGVCVDYDPRAETAGKSWFTGTVEEIFSAQTSRRVRLTSGGNYTGPYAATIYWTPC